MTFVLLVTLTVLTYLSVINLRLSTIDSEFDFLKLSLTSLIANCLMATYFVK